MTENKGPYFKVKAGGIETAVWENDGKNGKYYTVSQVRNYKDGEEWKKTQSLRVSDVPKAIASLQEVYTKLLFEDKKEKE